MLAAQDGGQDVGGEQRRRRRRQQRRAGVQRREQAAAQRQTRRPLRGLQRVLPEQKKTRSEASLWVFPLKKALEKSKSYRWPCIGVAAKLLLIEKFHLFG